MIYTEVVVGGKGPGNIWLKGSKPRRIVGIRVIPNIDIEFPSEIVTFSKADQEKFEQAITGANVEVIKVKVRLGCYIIGQAIIGIDIVVVS